MGEAWDGGNVAFRPETWEAVCKVLYPGALLLAFGSRRTYHWLACAIERAGFEPRDMLSWMYAQGMPHSVDISKVIDKRMGGVRRVIGKMRVATDRWTVEGRKHSAKGDTHYYVEVTAPASKEAKLWEGYGTDMKPCLEPLLCARAPMLRGDTLTDNVLRYGTGALNIDGSRVKVQGEKLHVPQSDPKNRKGKVGFGLGISNASKAKFQKAQRESVERAQKKGRWPSQLILQHHRDCECVGVMAVSGRTINRFVDGAKPFGGAVGCAFTSEKFPDERLPVYRCHPDCPIGILDGQSGVLKSGLMRAGQQRRKSKGDGGYHGGMPDEATAAGTFGDAGGASRFFYHAKVTTKEKNAGLPVGVVNEHKALKPVDLCRYFAKLLLPPKQKKPRRILVCFAGSGSEILGCLEAGWDEVVGIEQDRKTASVCKHRIAAHIKK